MKTTLTAIADAPRAIATINQDQPTNGECLADIIHKLESECTDPSTMLVPPWMTKTECMNHTAEMIASLTVVNDTGKAPAREWC